MRIGELREREDYQAILEASLSHAFAVQHGREFRISSSGPGEEWRCNELLSAYFRTNLVAEGRRYLKDSLRFTSRVSRSIPQFVLGTALGSRIGLKHFSKRGFVCDPPLTDADAIVVVPGNERIRLFDFRRSITRVVAKVGFSRSGIATEADLRGPGMVGPYANMLACADDSSWFEEPILDGWCLPRCPPWVRQRHVMTRALERLATWQETTRVSCDAAEWARTTVGRARESVRAVGARFRLAANFDAMLNALVLQASELGNIVVARAHGDFQPGNVFVLRSGEVLLIDWEYSRPRYEHYDRLVLALGLRGVAPLAKRAGAFLQGLTTHLPASIRRGALALVLLEDFDWMLQQTVDAGFPLAPPLLTRRIAQVGELAAFNY